MRRLLALVLAALVAVAPAALLAAPGLAQAAGSTPTVTVQSSGSSPFTPGVPQAPVTAPTTPTITVPASTSSSSSGSGGLSGTTSSMIAIGAVVVLGGIAYFIWRDSRRHAPVRHAALEGVDGRSSGSKRRQKSRKLSAAERKRRKRGRAR